MAWAQDVTAAFGLYLLAIFVSKFWEAPIVWVLENFVFKELKFALEQIRRSQWWLEFDQYLKNNPTLKIADAIEDARSSLGLTLKSDWVWALVRRRIRLKFNFDAYREYIYEGRQTSD